jgi:excisionase family DNA binding protein
MPESQRTWQPLSLPVAALPCPTLLPTVALGSPSAKDHPAAERILLTKAEAAHGLGVSLSIVDRLIRTGQLPVVRFEQRIVRVRVVDLHAFAERHLEKVDFAPNSKLPNEQSSVECRNEQEKAGERTRDSRPNSSAHSLVRKNAI